MRQSVKAKTSIGRDKDSSCDRPTNKHERGAGYANASDGKPCLIDRCSCNPRGHVWVKRNVLRVVREVRKAR